jgi:signal transduction histidine kinase
MEQFTGTSLRKRLFLTVLVAFLPLAVLVLYVAQDQKNLTMEKILNKTEMLARAAAGEEAQQMESTRHLLAAIADAFLMVPGIRSRLNEFVAGILRQAEGYAGFGVLNPEGHLVAGSGFPAKIQDYSDRQWFKDCLDNKEFAVADYSYEHLPERPVLFLALPAIDRQGKIAAIVFCAVYLDWMNRSLFHRLAELPHGSRMILANEAGNVLRYDSDSESWNAPHRFDGLLLRQMIHTGSGTLSASDEVGVPHIYAFAPFPRSVGNRQDLLVLEVPRKLALGAATRLFARNVALLTLSLTMAALAVWWTSDRIFIRRIRKIVHTSRRLAAGDLDARIGRIGPKDELNHLAAVFDEMAVSLQNRIKKEAQARSSLETSREKLRRLAAHQQEVREQERIRIAREIHDQLGQSLTILKMDLAWLKRKGLDFAPEAAEKAAAMGDIIDRSLKDLHTVTAELRPILLDDFGLSAAMEWQLEEFQQRSGIHCRLETDGLETDLTADQATALFRIFQETLTNVARHAQATEVTVRLETRDGQLILRVQDNGRGITEAEIHGSEAYGLLGIRERLYPWRGRVLFEGQAGKGTRVTICLPISKEEKPDD